MNRYTVSKTLGDGTYGSVFRAVHKETGEVVAIKVMKKKFSSWQECVSLREVKALRALSHPNIVKLKEVIREAGQLFMVFEYLDANLYEAAKGRAEAAAAAGRPRAAAFPERTIRNIVWQLLQSLAYMHRNNYWHRDIKPENCLIRLPPPAGSGGSAAAGAESSSPGGVADGMADTYLLKLADFGLAREIRSRPPYTDYVSTRWYRAPEVLLRDPAYSSPIDVFAVGCIAAELFNLAPLFPGASEVDQLGKLIGVLGPPHPGVWPEGVRLAAKLGYAFPAPSGYAAAAPRRYADMGGHMPTASPDAADLVARMLAWNPAHRPTAGECLRHPFFTRQWEGAAGSVPRAVGALAASVPGLFVSLQLLLTEPPTSRR